MENKMSKAQLQVYCALQARTKADTSCQFFFPYWALLRALFRIMLRLKC